MEVRKDFSVSSLHLVIQSENFRFGFLMKKSIAYLWAVKYEKLSLLQKIVGNL